MGGGSRAGRGEGSGARSTGTGGVCRRRPVGGGKKVGRRMGVESGEGTAVEGGGCRIYFNVRIGFLLTYGACPVHVYVRRGSSNIASEQAV